MRDRPRNDEAKQEREPQRGPTRRQIVAGLAAAGLSPALANAAKPTTAALSSAADLPVAAVLLTSPRADGVLDDAGLLARLFDLARAQGALLHSPVPLGTPIHFCGQPLGIVLAQDAAQAARAAHALQTELQTALRSQATGPQLVMATAVQGAVRSNRADEFDLVHGDAEGTFHGQGAAYRLKQTYAQAAELPSYGAPLWVEAQAQRPLPLIVLSHPHEAMLRDRLAGWGKLPADWITLSVASPDGESALFEIPAKLAWSASSKLRRPVRLHIGQDEARIVGGQRPEVIQTVTLGADRQGHIVSWVGRTIQARAIDEAARQAKKQSSGTDAAAGLEPCGLHTRLLYQPDHVELRHLIAPQNIGPSAAQPWPGLSNEAFAVEIALDELAGLLQIDPLALRIENAKPRGPIAVPDQSALDGDARAALTACHKLALQRMPDAGPPQAAGTKREGNHRLGVGCAVGARPVLLVGGGGGAGAARTLGCVLHRTRLRIPDGSARIEVLQHVAVLHGVAGLRDRQAAVRRALRAILAAWWSTVRAAPQYDPESGALQDAPQSSAQGAPASIITLASPDAIQVEFADSPQAAIAADSTPPDDALLLADVEALTACGATAALANALYHATGFRQRTLPLDLSLLTRPLPAR